MRIRERDIMSAWETYYTRRRRNQRGSELRVREREGERERDLTSTPLIPAKMLILFVQNVDNIDMYK